MISAQATAWLLRACHRSHHKLEAAATRQRADRCHAGHADRVLPECMISCGTAGFPGPIMVQLWSTYRSAGLLNVSSVAIRIASFQ